jgi:hypothetical protein
MVYSLKYFGIHRYNQRFGSPGTTGTAPFRPSLHALPSLVVPDKSAILIGIVTFDRDYVLDIDVFLSICMFLILACLGLFMV